MQSKLIAFRNMQADLARWDGSINEALRIRIERRILAVLRSVSGLMLPETSRIGILQKLAFCFRMVLAPAVAPKFRLRVEYALSFFGIQFHARIKNSLRHLFKVRGGHAEAHSQKDSSTLA